MADCLRETHRVARRRHRRPCFSCRLPILPGDPYVEGSHAGDGRIWSTVEHKVCAVEMRDQMGSEPYHLGALREDADSASPAWRRWYGPRSAMPTLLGRLAWLFYVRYRIRARSAEVARG